MKKLLLCPLLFLSFAQAESFHCKVINIIDGNNITCITENEKQTKVKLYQINAPENNQAYGQRAKQALTDMIFGKTVRIEKMGLDRYKRTLGVIMTYNRIPCKSAPPDEPQPFGCYYLTNINLEMIKQGYARFDASHGENPEYQQAEQDARAAKRGLWTDKDVISP